jgi:ribosome biogenesis GTPase
MREFGIPGAESGIRSSYSDITALSSRCRYRDCSHTVEKGCAVLDAVHSGQISHEHFDNYLKLRKESEFYEMSRAEKKQKERDFGKHKQSVKKNLKKG